MYRLAYFIFIFISFTSFSQSLTVEDIWRDYKFYARGVDGFRSMNDGEHFTQFSSKGITKHSFRDYQGQAEVILSKKDMSYNSTQLSVDNYEFNSDETKVLLMVDQTSIYRRSYTAVHYLFDLENFLRI